MKPSTSLGRIIARLCIVGILMLGVPPRPCGAQTTPAPADTSAVNHFERLFLTLQPGATLRIETTPGVRSQGDYTGLRGVDVLLIQDAGDTLAIPFQSVTRAWERGRHVDTGMRVGAIVGGVGGAGFGGFVGLVVSALCETGDCPGPVGAIIVGALVGGVLGVTAGVILGGILGAAFPRWQEMGS